MVSPSSLLVFVSDMFGRKKEAKRSPAVAPRTTRDPNRPPPRLSAFGLMDVPSIEELENPEEDTHDDQVRGLPTCII